MLNNNLFENIQLFKMIIDSIPDIILVLDNDHNIISFNKAWLDHLKIKNEITTDIIGKKCYEVLKNRNDICGGCIVEKVYKSKKPAKEERYIEVIDKWTELCVYPLLDNDDNLLGVVKYFYDIDCKKKIDEKLKNSEEKYRGLFERFSDAIVLVEIEKGTIVEFNEKAHSYLGYTKEEFKNIKISDFEVLENDQDVLNRLNKVLKNGFDEFETKHRTKDGTILDMHIYCKLIEISGKKIVQSVWRDVTDLKKAERDLRESNEKFRILSESSVEGIAIHERGVIKEANSQFFKMIGYEKKEITDKQSISIIIPPELRKKMEELVDSDISTEYEIEYIRKDGSKFDAMVHSKPLVHNGKKVRVACVRDISETKKHEKEMEKVERELRESNEKMFLLTHSAIEGVVVHEKGVIKEANLQFFEMLEYEEKELINKDFVSIIVPSEFREEMKKKAISEKNENYETELIRKNGSRFDSIIYSRPLIHDGKKVRVLVARDISESKRYERNLEKIARELEQSNKELEEFAYIASHDLQEPLRTVSSYCQFIEDNYGERLDLEGHKFMGYIIDATARMKYLIKDLLDFSKVGREGKPIENINSNVLLKDIIKDFKVTKEETSAEIKFDKKLPIVTGERVRIRQLFYNLISNAIKFRRKGVIPVVKIGCEDNEYFWKFYVKDNGVGIEEKQFRNIFGIFKRLYTREEYPGTGIGLAVCKRIVENMGGKIWVESEKNKGSVFYFTLSKNKNGYK